MAKNKEEQETEETEEESDLEEDLEEAELEIEEDKFVEFIAPSNESSSTTLNQVGIATELKATDLEQDLSNVVGLENNKKEEEDPFKYKIGADPAEGPKYIASGNEIERTVAPSNVDIMSLGKEKNLLPNEIGFSASPTTKIGEVEGPGKYELPGRTNVNELGKSDPFQKKEVKYESSKEY